MGELIAVRAAGLAVAGGAAYALYGYDDTPDLSTCPVARGACCGRPGVSDVAPGDPRSPAVALAGPVTLFASAPVQVATRCGVYGCRY
jgi:hypothetical protein